MVYGSARVEQRRLVPLIPQLCACASAAIAVHTSTCMQPGDTDGSPNASACFISSALLALPLFWSSGMAKTVETALVARKWTYAALKT